MLQPLRRAAWRRAARPPRLTYGRSTGPPAIWFLVPDWPLPSGGVRVAYRHVDLLHEAGRIASVLQGERGSRPTWFPNTTPVRGARGTTVRDSDVLVIPEVWAKILPTVPVGVRCIVFDQSAHLIWQQPGSPDAYRIARSLIGVLTVSDYAAKALSQAFPDVAVRRIHLSVDTRRFQPAPRPERRLAWMPRRAGSFGEQVLDTLMARHCLDGWELAPIDGLSEQGVAEQLGSSSIFLSFTDREGFGLPAAEAMASGCYVVGCHGQGGREMFLAEHCLPVESGDASGFVTAVESVVRQENEKPGWCRTRGLRARAFIDEHYSVHRERLEVISYYDDVLSRAPCR